MICGAPGSGTSFVTKLLRHSGMFAGSDAGPMDARKFHESTAFQIVNNRLLEATIGFPHAPKTTQQFLAHLRQLDDRRDELLGMIDVDSLLESYWGDRTRCDLWGWKDPRNAANVLIWKSLFPEVRMITITKRWRWSERTVKGTLAGDWYRSKSNRRLRKLYRQPPYAEDVDTFALDFDDLTQNQHQLNRLRDWLGLPAVTGAQHNELMLRLDAADNHG